MQPIVLDFETHPIQGRPNYPPRPVGLAAHFPGMAPFYLAWGHETGQNTCAQSLAHEWLDKAWRSQHPVLCHNAKFDMEVATVGFGLPMLPWHRVHDTMFLAFLANPHAHSLALKDLADDLLGIPPDEKDAVAAWVMAHSADLLARFPAYKISPTQRSITKS